ncbi:hypothetical protein GYMLUDRAFT_929332 [Collybiopsis luxurians FD-317 M1]|nr:hypothetical protein GYMLUDRAFT_929332 [Collybiopsis luxurians FD-317 M1]
MFHIPKASVYRFGDGKYAQPLFRDVAWTVKEGESWAVVGSGAEERRLSFSRPSSAAIEYHRTLLSQAVSSPFSISPASTHTRKSPSFPSDTGNKPEANFTTMQRGTALYKKNSRSTYPSTITANT